MGEQRLYRHDGGWRQCLMHVVRIHEGSRDILRGGICDSCSARAWMAVGPVRLPLLGWRRHNRNPARKRSSDAAQHRKREIEAICGRRYARTERQSGRTAHRSQEGQSDGMPPAEQSRARELAWCRRTRIPSLCLAPRTDVRPRGAGGSRPPPPSRGQASVHRVFHRQIFEPSQQSWGFGGF